MITAVDTNILLDLLLPDEPHGEAAEGSLAQAVRGGAVVICEPVYAELAHSFPNQGDLDAFLADTGVRLLPSLPAALYAAGEAWRAHTRRRPTLVACPRCGNEQDARCERCAAPLRPRQHLVADFMIGGHALIQADRLLTRDRGYYRTYFPRPALPV